MKFPKKLKILAHIYRIKMDKNLDKRANSSGTCCANVATIRIDNTFVKLS